MTKKKGVQKIVDLAPSLLEKHKNLLFVMIGDGPLREKLERTVGESRFIRKLPFYRGSIQRKSAGIS